MTRFSELLHAHLDNGARPTGLNGARWTTPEFAKTVSIEERTVRNWRNGAARPNDLGRIETALFGDNPAHDEARAELRAAFDGQPYQAKTKVAPVQSVAAAKPTNLPYPTLGSLFTGRADYLKQLRESLLAGQPTAINGKAIHGLGGVGKTRAAVEYAHAHQADTAPPCSPSRKRRRGCGPIWRRWPGCWGWRISRARRTRGGWTMRWAGCANMRVGC